MTAVSALTDLHVSIAMEAAVTSAVKTIAA